MQLQLDQDEAWSLMMMVTAHAVDNGGVSSAAKQKIRQWQRDHGDGSPAMVDLAADMNESLGAHLDDSTNRLVKRKGRYTRKKDGSA